MILLTRLNGPQFAINADLIERAESTPDTVLTMVDGTKYVVRESLEELVERIREFRASVVALSTHLELQLPDGPILRAVPDQPE
ncbi:MAG: flagellar FlbD family protein [Acidimicrobiia bacterium]